MKKQNMITKRITAGILTLILVCSLCTDALPVYAASEAFSSDDIVEPVDDIVVGRDGVAHEGVDYLPAASVACLDAQETEVYRDMCDEAAQISERYGGVDDVVLSLDENGELAMSCFMPLQDMYEEFYGIDEDETLEDTAIISEDITFADEESEDYEYEPLADDEEDEYIPANIERAGAVEVEEGYIEGDDLVSLDSLFAEEDINYFRNQLNSTARGYFDKAKKSMVNGKKNSFSTSGMASSYNIADSLSALITTYSSSFGWMDKGSKGGWSAKWTWSRYAGYNTSVTIRKSKYYSSGLQSSANSKVKELVENAYEYAGKYYPNNPTYGIVRYFDDWLCANNYYNHDCGTGAYGVDKDTDEYYYCHSPYGCLLMGYGVCESYAMAMSMLLDTAGIRNIFVAGYANEGHAWNHVRMPNGSYYMLDSTWNDIGSASSRSYFLTKKDNEHRAQGKIFTNGSNFNFPVLSSSDYTQGAETIALDTSEIILPKNKSVQIKVGDYYSKFAKTWTSDNTKAAKVDGNGKVKTVAPGAANITCNIAGKDLVCKVYVYQFTGLKFENNKSNMSAVYANPDDTLDSHDKTTYKIAVGQKEPVLSAQTIYTKKSMADPKISFSKKGVAEVDARVSGDYVLLDVTPLKMGSTTVTVKFAGKTAKLKYSVKQAILPSMFDLSAVNDLAAAKPVYTGKAYKPAVKRSDTAPKGLSYKVKYTGNVNAGTATVTISGKGSYGGTVTGTFSIAPVDISGTNVTVSVSELSKYKAKKANPAVTKVKVGKKTLKKGKDYEVLYNGGTDVPIEPGTYTVKIYGKGNYTGLAGGKTFTYEIRDSH